MSLTSESEWAKQIWTGWSKFGVGGQVWSVWSRCGQNSVESSLQFGEDVTVFFFGFYGHIFFKDTYTAIVGFDVKFNIEP